MGASLLSLVLLLVTCFTFATHLSPRFDRLKTDTGNGPLANTLGESRRLFANHFFTRSDIYFHSGYYPSIFDQAGPKRENHLADSASGRDAEHHDQRSR